MWLLNDLYEQADQKRKKTEHETSEKKRLFYRNFAHDSDKIRDAIIEIIKPLCVAHISRGDDQKEKVFQIWDIQKQVQPEHLDLKTNVKFMTFFNGFWDSSSRTHSFDTFTAAKRKGMIDELNLELKPITVKNISDPGKSLRFVISVTIPSRPQ